MSTPAEILARQGVERLYRVIVGNDPAANTEFDIVVPGGVIWLVKSLYVRLTNDANAINRGTDLTLDDGSRVYCYIPTSRVTVASQTWELSWIPGQFWIPTSTTIQGVQTGFPAMPLLSGHHIRSVTWNRQVGDNYAAPVLYVEEVQQRGLAAEIAYELRNLIREDAELTTFERGGF